MRNCRRILPLGLAAVLLLAGCGGSGSDISGAGATFPQPVYDQWSADIKAEQGFVIDYNPIGSGGGIAQLISGTVSFAGSDVAMDDAELADARKRGQPLHVPSIFGSVALAYNLPGSPAGIRLTGETLARIYLGEIRRWNDPAIVELNPDVRLPDLQITPIYRSDASGTTKLFTGYLAAHSKAWAKRFGAAKTAKWPTGTGAAKNAGVAGAVKLAEGTLGYVELAYAVQNKFRVAALKNRAGAFVLPSAQSGAQAGVGIELPDDLRFSAIDSPNPEAYPIASATFLLVWRDACRAGLSPAAAESVKRLLDHGLGSGQQTAAELGFSPLPDELLKRSQAQAAELQCNGRPLAEAPGSTQAVR